MNMRYTRILLLSLACLATLAAQTPAKPPANATPVAPSSPVKGKGPADEGFTAPLPITKPTVVPDDTLLLQVGDLFKLDAKQYAQILEIFPESQRVAVDATGRTGFFDQLLRFVLLSEEGKRRKNADTDLYRQQMAYMTMWVLANQTEGQIRKDAIADKVAIQAYYDAHKADWDEVKARHILIRVQGSSTELPPGKPDLNDAQALAKAQEIRAKLVAGYDFGRLAQTESYDSYSAANGGDIGALKRGMAFPSFDEAVFALATGDISQPVKTKVGYHIIKVDERKPTRTFEDLRSDIEKTVGNAAVKKFVDEQKAKYKIYLDQEFVAPPKLSGVIQAR
jgi:hypothetical protein